MPQSQSAGPETVLLAGGAQAGEVVLSHHSHQDVSACVDCHHTYEQGSAVDACRDCHGPDPGASPPKRAFHDSCRGCHAERGAGPVECAACHQK